MKIGDRDRCKNVPVGTDEQKMAFFAAMCSAHCDQMAKLFFNVWPYTTMKISPKVFKICQRRFKFCQILNAPPKKVQMFFLNLAKVAKFCQVWSHWLRRIQWLGEANWSSYLSSSSHLISLSLSLSLSVYPSRYTFIFPYLLDSQFAY